MPMGDSLTQIRNLETTFENVEKTLNRTIAHCTKLSNVNAKTHVANYKE